MKKVAAMMLGVALTSSYALAGTVVFMPGNTNIDISAPGPVDIQVALFSDGGGTFQGVDAVIGSELLPITGFTYSAASQDPSTGLPTQTAPTFDNGLFPFDVFLSANNTGGGAAPSGLVIGTVTLDPTGVALSLGQVFEVFVDADDPIRGDGFSGLSGPVESLNGTGTITVVPEPATMTLLGLAAIGLIRRRRSA